MLASKMERRIHNILVENHVPFQEEYIFKDLYVSSGRCLRFDFAIFNEDGSLAFLIEAQGKQHFQPVEKFGGVAGLKRQQYNDAKKREYCVAHNIMLVTIPFWDENKITYNYIFDAAGY